ncbi:hypothetical protein F6U93_13710 [Tamlana haliotis]|uniref:T9SS C-terminal target domain-containing protein n=1 Tax=Pseudotamlana haliotis TaxID=2614804 RepID=A0A6N6M921_9FLAO|nr:hypothetical protein [Tamlana haliotis]KAB1066904.1 hypothetical protein F6U93_13710 [Tamlana haliotis]
MKNFNSIMYLLLVVSGSINAQQERGIVGPDNWLSSWTEFTPSRVNYGENIQVLSGVISEDTTLYKKHIYLLIGDVFVTNSAILGIEPGTVVMGDSKTNATLTITPGAAIIAEGTPLDPIIFTSNNKRKKAGDWGGIIILGDVQTNRFGKSYVASLYTDIEPTNYEYTKFGDGKGENHSGFISHLRIEYAGRSSNNSDVSNGLLLAGVGAKTLISNVMVSYSGGHSFGIVGGEVNMNQMFSNKSKGNDYDIRYGAVCHIINALAVRSPYISSSEFRCMNVLSYANEAEVDVTNKQTEVVAKNMALLTDSQDLDYDVRAGLIKEAVFIGADTNFTLDSSVISGFNKAVILDENIKVNDEYLSKIQLRNTCFNQCSGNVFSKLKEDNFQLENWYNNPSFFNDNFKTSHAEFFMDLSSNIRDYRLNIQKIIAMNKVSESSEN